MGGPAGCKEAAAKREPDRASIKEKRRTERNRPVGPTLIKCHANHHNRPLTHANFEMRLAVLLQA